MKWSALKCGLSDILSFRSLFLQENNFQIRYNACHERNWSDSYLLTADDVEIGYGSVKGKSDLKDRDAIFEFYVIPPYRKNCRNIFSELIKTSGALFIECQSNDFLLSSMLYEFAKNIYADVVLFKDNYVTHLNIPGITFRAKTENDEIFEHHMEPIGNYVLEKNEVVVATGGFMLHYNLPFADLYMEVKENFRRQGLGSYLIQELKRECYTSGRVPAARCSITNIASKSTLINGGLQAAGFMLMGECRGFKL